MQKPPRDADEMLINGWVFFRYMVVGVYVGFATVGSFAYWYMYYDWAGDGHSLITFDQLSHWSQCPTWTDFKVNDFNGKPTPCILACRPYISEPTTTKPSFGARALRQPESYTSRRLHLPRQRLHVLHHRQDHCLHHLSVRARDHRDVQRPQRAIRGR
jgi:hypothetical protein